MLPCLHSIPDGVLVCPICLSLKYDEGIQKFQLEFLRKAKTGEAPLRVMKKPPRHVLLYGDDWRTFCGQNLRPPPNVKNPQRPQVSHARVGTLNYDEACPDCRIAIAQAFEGME